MQMSMRLPSLIATTMPLMPLRPAAAMYSLPSDPRELDFCFCGPLSWGVDALLVVLVVLVLIGPKRMNARRLPNPGLFRGRANRCSTAMQLAYGLDVRRMAVAAEARAVESLAAVGQAADMAVQLSCGNARLASGPAEAAAVEAPVASVPADPAALATAALVAVLGAVAAQAAAA